MAYKKTLNLPKTKFPMRASLPQREPAMVKLWKKQEVYAQMLAKRREARRYVLHDGPPFANGDAHMGTALNKILKDFCVKSKAMLGNYTPFIPGWDCHGLPIELKVIQKNSGLSKSQARQKSAEFAQKFITIQRNSFRRLGCFADWQRPYITMRQRYEADVMRAFAVFVDKELVYQGLRPALWSYAAGSAIADTEAEYKMRVDPSIFVAFPSMENDAEYLIWTTTPWTLPANRALAMNPNFDYEIAIFAKDGEEKKMILAAELVDRFCEVSSWRKLRTLAIKKGKDFEGRKARRPFMTSEEDFSPVLMADFVGADAGSGIVHIAPGHGQDDYQVGMQNKLEVFSPVDAEAKFTEEVGVAELIGEFVLDANAKIVEILRNSKLLLHKEDYEHSYPHCPRTKQPIIFRALKQFFINVSEIREDALKLIDGVDWHPTWGRNRIYATLEKRTDWCISRQRAWGTPLPAFFKPNGELILSGDLARKVADFVTENGSNAWFEADDAELARQFALPEDSQKCEDTLDVWLDSGISHLAVLDRIDSLGGSPADLYLEATDQHRGWFQSSLVTSCVLRGAAPYRKVITHGYVLDQGTGEKISKSSGRPVDVSTYVEKYGADLVRLWAASVNYVHDAPFSENIFEQTADVYRRFRNTLRILLANLYDYEASFEDIKVTELNPLDKLLLHKLEILKSECRSAYDVFDFHKVYQLLNKFCAQDLSAFYIDVSKDRMYCDAADSPRRRSTQKTMLRIADNLARLLAPILSFTAEELWQSLRELRGLEEFSSIFCKDFPAPRSEFVDEELDAKFESLMELRELAQKEIEEQRKLGKIGSSLEARLRIRLLATSKLADLLTELGGEELVGEVLIVSDLEVEVGNYKKLQVKAEQTSFAKCERCWRHLPEVETNSENLCQRCEEVVN